MDKAHIETEKMLEIMEKHIASIYSRAYKEISKKWVEYLKKAEKKADSLLKAVSTAKTPEDKAKAERQYKAYLRSVTLRNKRYKEMVEQTANRLLAVNETALQYINGQLPDVYIINHNGLAGVIEKDLAKNGVSGVSFTMYDENTVKKLATTNATLLPYKYINGKKDVRWNTKKINAEVLQGILQGESINTISKRLEAVQDMNRTSAVRNARTMVTSAENSGRLAVFEEAERRGLKFGKVWLATNDKRVRHAHNILDGVVVEDWRKPFETVLWLSKAKRQPDSIMYPGDPSAHPANVYNCRCSLSYKYLGVIENVNNNTTENIADVKELNSKTTFTPAKTIDEAKRYAQDKFGFWTAQYEKMDINFANELNKEIERMQGTFGNLSEKGYLTGVMNIKQRVNFYAAYSSGGRVIGFKNVSGKNTITKMLKDAKEQKSLGFWSTGDALHSVRHEIGHAVGLMAQKENMGAYNRVDILKKKVSKKCGLTNWSIHDTEEIKQKSGEYISYYALRNADEFISEAIAEYMSGNPRQLAKDVVEILTNPKVDWTTISKRYD